MTRELLLLTLAVVPPLFLLLYYYRQDKAKPEPFGMILRVFIWGCFSIIPALVLEVAADRINTAYIKYRKQNKTVKIVTIDNKIDLYIK